MEGGRRYRKITMYRHFSKMKGLDIYSRMEEKVEEMKGDWKTLFESSEMTDYLRRYVGNLIAGVYDSLRVQGAIIPKGLEEAETNRFRLEKIFDPNAECQTAYCGSTDKEFVICVNGAGELVRAVDTVEEKFEVIVGLIVHEVGHRLFTDFRTFHAALMQMGQQGKWYPIPPERIQTVEGINMQARLYQNPEYRGTVAMLLKEIRGVVEDGYIENEMKSHYPGLASTYLGAMNEVFFADADSLTKVYEGKDPSKLVAVLGQWVLYGEFGETKIGERDESEFPTDVMEAIYEGMDYIDEIVNLRDPRRRCQLINELAVILSPFLDEELQKKDKNADQTGGNSSANQAARNKIQQAASGSSGGKNSSNNRNEQNTPNSTQGVANTTKSSNSGLQQKVNQSSQSSDGKNPDKNADKNGDSAANSISQAGGGSGSRKGPPVDHSAAERDLGSMLSDAAASKVKQEMEKERTEEIQEEANNLDHSISGVAPEITRAEKVPEANKAAYAEAAPRTKKISKRLAQLLLKQLKQYEDDELLPWQYSGTKFSSKQYCRDSMKGFKRSDMPRPAPNLSVYVLCDESASVTTELSNAEVSTAIILEDFCRTLNIPLCVQGYTSSVGSCEILSYVEEKKIDDEDKYRITGMSSRGGTPTVAAMEYALGRLRKQDSNRKKLLFVITDGCAGDDTSDGQKTKQLLERAKREKVTVIACGIGSVQAGIKRQFGEDHFLSIDDLDGMPMRLVDIVRRHMDGIRR